MYRTDLATMVGILFQQSIELRAEVSQVDGIEGPSLVRVVVMKGNIVACSIEKQGGAAISGDMALRIVDRLGALEWIHTPLEKRELALPMPQTASPADTPAAEILPSSIPIRVGLVEQHKPDTWPRTQRLVFNLVDGNKSVQRIAQLLAKPCEVVQKILYILYANDIIVLSSRPVNDPHSAETHTLQSIFEKKTTR